LDQDEPVRFIFSHSMLGVGWDNPNVFQICTLREMGTETERRQTLGRGLRLPVAKTERGYERVADRGIATLTVIANESYAAFADSLQHEYKKAGVAIGQVRPGVIAKLAKIDAEGRRPTNCWATRRRRRSSGTCTATTTCGTARPRRCSRRMPRTFP